MTAANPLTSLKAWADLAIAKAGRTSTLVAWFDAITEVRTLDVNGVVATSTPAAPTQVAGNATSLFAAVYSVPTVAAVSTFDNSVGNEVRTFVFDLNRDALGNIDALAAGEGFTITYASGGSLDFKQTSTTNLTVSSLVTYMNADTSLAAANLDLDAALDSAERYIYTISYGSVTNGVTTAGAVSVAGNIKANFGTDYNGNVQTLLVPITASEDKTDIAEGFRAKIDALVDYNAVSITTGTNALSSFYVTRDVSGTANIDRSPLMAAAPTLDIIIDVAMTSTTAVLGKAGIAGFQSASSLSNTYLGSRISLPDVTPTLESNLRITLRGTNGLAMNSNVSMVFAGNVSNTAISGTLTNAVGSGPMDLLAALLVDGVGITSAASNGSSGTTDATATTYYVAAAADISAGTENVSVAGVTAITTDRTGWL